MKNILSCCREIRIQNEIDQTKKEIGLDIPEEKLEEWKKEYRRIDKHRRI